MKRLLRWGLIGLSLAAGMLLLARFFPVSLPTYMDFQMLYAADKSLSQGIALYDQARQLSYLPFPYPPWYALSTLFLAWIPLDFAARLWFELNLTMLLLSAWTLSDGWKPWQRLASFIWVPLFMPALGTLLVGQYTFPVLLGAALMVRALRDQRPGLVSLAAVLLTFKPHLGGLILLASLVHLVLRRDAFGRRALLTVAITGLAMFALGFLADPVWPVDYLQALSAYRQISGVTSCRICVSLPVTLVTLVTGEAQLAPAVWVTLALLVSSAWLVWRFEVLRQPPEGWLALVVVVTLLINPYLLNYDYVLLLLPLLVLVGSVNSWKGWALTAGIYLLTWGALGLFSRQGNLSLIVSTLLAGIVLVLHNANRRATIDVSAEAA